MESRVIVEFLKDGCEVDEGEIGTIVVTDLEDNFVMPLIRYDMKDLGEKDARCSCGRELGIIENVIGRTSDLIIGLNGNIVHGEFFSHLLESSGIAQKNFVEKFQVIQKARDKIIFKIKSKFPLSDKDFNILNRIIRDYLGNMEIHYLQVKEIEPILGKYRFTISEVNLHDQDFS